MNQTVFVRSFSADFLLLFTVSKHTHVLNIKEEKIENVSVILGDMVLCELLGNSRCKGAVWALCGSIGGGTWKQ